MSDKPYAELKGIAEKIENESFKALNFGMPAQEMILCSVEAIRRYRDYQDKNKQKNLDLFIEVLEVIASEFDIYWLTEEDREKIIKTIINRLKCIEVE